MSESHNERRKYRHLRQSVQPLPAKICQHAIFGLALLVLLLAPLSATGRNSWMDTVVQGLIWVAGLLWLIRIVIRREIEWAAPRVVIPVLVVFGYVLLRSALAPVASAARAEAVLCSSAALLFLVLHCNFSHRWQSAVLLWTWVALALGLALHGVGQVLVGEQLGWAVAPVRGGHIPASGPFAVPAHYGAYLIMILALVAANVFHSRHGYRQKIALVACAMGLGLAVILTLAHEVWWGLVAMALALAVYLIRGQHERIRWALLGIGALAGVLLVVLIGWQGVDRAAYQDGGPLPYLSLWRAALEMSFSNLIVGNGPGMFPWLFAGHRTGAGYPLDARSEPLTVLMEYGLVGVALLVWVAVAFLWAMVRLIAERTARYSEEAHSNRLAFAIGGLAAFVGMAVQALLDCQTRTPANLLTLAAMMAIALTCGVRSASKSTAPVDPAGDEALSKLQGPAKVAVVLALVLGLGFLGLRLQEMMPAAYYLDRAEREKAHLNWAAAEELYLRAWKFYPRNDAIAAAYGDFFAARATWNIAQRKLQAQHALRWYATAREINPYAHDLLVKTARLHDLLGQPETAWEQYTRAIQADPDNAAYHVQLGLHYLRWGDDKATAAFRRARELGDPSGISEYHLSPAEVPLPASDPDVSPALKPVS